MGLCYALITFLSLKFYGGVICSRIRLHLFHVWFCRGKGSSLHILILTRMGDCLEFVTEFGVELGHDDVRRVLGLDWYEIGEEEVLLRIRFQSWSLNHHSRKVDLVENRQGGVVDVDAWDELFSGQLCDGEVGQSLVHCFEKLMEHLERRLEYLGRYIGIRIQGDHKLRLGDRVGIVVICVVILE